MSRFLALPVAFTATVGASIKRIHDAKAQRQRAHAQAKRAELCAEYCQRGPKRPPCSCKDLLAS